MEHTKYIGTSTSWRRRSLNRVPRNDLYYLIKRAFLPTCDGTTDYVTCNYVVLCIQ